ncbi:MAG: NrfD/PsrC family molybdoenzyme membrane anchor subunit [Planctomycetota bacterium]|jgi:formate-dependent nitrite reductase membrane component NrfD
MEPKVNGMIQQDWGWLIAIYLFLGGLGAGAYSIGALNALLGDTSSLSTTIGLWIGFPALALGCLCLLADLGSPSRAVLAGMKPGSSWIARGTWIICLFMLCSLLHLILHEFAGVTDSMAVTVIAVIGIVTAVLTMAYTGLLLGVSKGIPFWRSGVVPVVFVVSALVTGHFIIMLCMAIFGDSTALIGQFRTMALEGIGLVALEVLVIVFFLHVAYKLPDPRESVQRILRRPSFVIGYFLLGLLVPLLLMVLTYRTMEGSGGSVAWIAIGAVLGLIGGLILRQSVLVVGVMPTLNIAGFEFRRIARPKEPKPDIGLMPPK